MMDMKKMRLLFAGGLLVMLSACEHISLYFGHTEGEIPVRVIINWEGEPEERLPQGMDVYWFPSGYGNVWNTEFNDRNGGYDYLYADVFTPLCLDYEGNENLLTRTDGTREGMEVYNRAPDTRPVYCDSVTPLENEVIALEALAPYSFYVDDGLQEVDAASARWDDTLTVYFTPRNVLREYSFMIYGVEGAENMVRTSGAISGMSGSYLLATGALASHPTTLLFTRTEAIRNGQNGRPGQPWTETEKALFAAKDPNWEDPLTGWTGDWLIGYFSTFGPVDTEHHRCRLTIEAYSTGNNYYYGAWGYRHGEWEDEKPLSVGEQIARATGDMQAPLEDRLLQQEEWRAQNGGFDLLLYNDRRLPAIPNDAPSNAGGFDLTIDPWGDVIDVPAAGAGGLRGAYAQTTNAKTGPLRSAPSYTPDNLPGFVINGVWDKDNNGANCEYFWNEQYVYRTEEGVFDYRPLKYWPPGQGVIRFQAYAPLSAGLSHGLKNAGSLGAKPDPVISYNRSIAQGADTPPPGVGEPIDLLVAVRETSLPVSSPKLQIHFRHALSRLQIQAGGASADTVIRIAGLEIKNLKISGYLTLKPDDASQLYSTGIPTGAEGFRYDSSGKVVLWENQDSPTSYPFVSATDDYTLGQAYMNIGDPAYIIPQVINDAADPDTVKVSLQWITYKADDNTLTKLASGVQTLPLPSGFTFEAGRSYLLKLESALNAATGSATWTVN